jgi:hypothetical protein
MTEHDLRQFTGSTEKHNLSNMCRPLNIYCSDGVKYLADQGRAFWLVDAILSHFPRANKLPQLKDDMQFWHLKVDEKKHSAVLYCTDGRTDEHLIEQKIPYTDFPLAEVKLYLANKFLYLPSEH